MEQVIEITDKFGRRRRARKGEVIAEGERIHFPATLMDAMQAAMADATAPDHTVRDAHGRPSGHTPGYAFGASDASLSEAATEAYVQRCQRLQDAWRHRDQPHAAEPALKTDVRGRAPDATQLTTDAEQAWQDKKQRLEQAWRQRR